MPVYFTESPPGLHYQPAKVRSGNDYEEYVEIYHVLPGTREVVPSGQRSRVRKREGSLTIRKLGTMAYLALLPARPQYPATVMQCAGKALMFLVQIIFYVYVVAFSWVMMRGFLEWGS